MTLLQLTFIFLLIFLQNIQQATSLYNPKPYLTIDTNFYGQNLSRVQQSLNGEYYIMIFDQQKIVVTQNESKNFQFLDSYICQTKQILEKVNYIYSPTSQGLMIWQISQEGKIVIYNTWQGQYILDQIIVDDDEQNAIGIYQAQIILLNISSKKFIQIQKVIGSVYTSSFDYFFFKQQFLFIVNVQYECVIYNLIDRNNGFQVFASQTDTEQPYHVLVKEQNGKIIAFFVTAYYGINIYDLTFLYTANSQTNVRISQCLIGYISINSVVLTGAISMDGNILFVGVRTSGINCYDISSEEKLKSPVFLQNLASNGLSNYIQLSNDSNQSKIYLADGIQFSIFTLLQENTKSKNSMLNTFNQEIQCLVYTPFQDVWSWQIQISANQKYISISSGQDGLSLYDVSQDYLDPVRIYKVKIGINVSHDGSLFLNKRNLLVVGHSQDGFSIVDISNPNKITYLVQFKFPFVSDCDGYDVDQSTETKLIVAAAQAGIVIVDISDVYKIRILSVLYPKEKLQKSGTKMVSVNKEFTHGFGCIRGVGILYFSINPVNYEMTLLQFFNSFGSENLWYDIFSYNYVYIADGVRGLTIIDVTDKNNPFILSNIVVGGWGEKVYQSRVNPNIVALSHSVIGSASIIDVSNKAFPIIQSQVKVENDSSYAPLLPNSLDYIIFTKNQGFKICNLKSPIQVLIQSAKQEKTFLSVKTLSLSNTTSVNENIGIDYKFVEFDPLTEVVQINQQIQFIFTLLITNRTAFISNTYFIVQDKRQNLPDWIHYQPQNSLFLAKIPSSALSNNDNGINIILVEVTSQIQESDFVNSQLNLTDSESTQIFTTLVTNNYIDQNGYLQSWIGSLQYQNFYLNWYDGIQFQIKNYDDTRVQKFILRKVSFSRYVEPIYFRVNTSNAFNIQYLQQKSFFINLYSQQVKVVFSLTSSNSSIPLNLVFNGQSYIQSQIMLLQEQSKVLTLFGNTDIINQSFYSYKIQIADLNSQQDNTEQIQNATIFIFIMDDQDIQYSQTFQIRQLQFMQIRSFPKIKKPLQQIVSNQINIQQSGIRSGDIIKLQIIAQQIFQFDQLLQPIEIKCFFIEGKSEKQCTELNWVDMDELIGQIIINTEKFSFHDELTFKIQFYDAKQKFPMQYFTELNIDYELLEKDLQILKKKNKKLYIPLQISQTEQTISPIQNILVSLILKQYYKVSDGESYRMYLKIKKILQEEFPYVDWYKPIIRNRSFSPPSNIFQKKKINTEEQPETNCDLKYHDLLSKFNIDTDKLIKVIQYHTVKSTGKVSKELIFEDKYDFELICECLKLDILGIDLENKPNWKRSAFGQYLIMDQLDIQNILLERNQLNDMYFKLKNSTFQQKKKKQSFVKNLYKNINYILYGDNFKTVGCHLVNSLIDDKRHWIQINQVSDNQVIIYIDSKIINQEGEYRLKFINSKGYVCCQQNFYYTNCIDKKKNKDSQKGVQEQMLNPTILNHIQSKSAIQKQIKVSFLKELLSEQNKPSQFKGSKLSTEQPEVDNIIDNINETIMNEKK
ncbi:LVIVD repeat protein (macronuclear) [Tetrahymena thermophila SB210]|uniref:LVIVD repeat protein n=1 Tax=Tetrahymena thermophila (strain SB210) TaxID=312017 RepID=Q237E5_TETTS|nr:LVIVD repeat protein [Tetrahymena thermophila SB210]EAR92796.2 LVIVD repeat protein [Tetrahymena thermophila SB210]|eukprot:XP_001013041.2 LVIVD repeat protein [Tetrahymena thermophila SB210]